MKIWFDSINNGINFYFLFAPAFMAAALLLRKKQEKINPAMFIINQISVMYIICLVSVTLFPLPSAEQASKLSVYDCQLIPFRFVADIIREKSLQSVAQVIFNIALTAPLGLLLRCSKKMTAAKAVTITFGVSLMIEIAQLTGLFFIYNGSYRLFDVDDLFLNTLGGFAGFCASAIFEGRKITDFLPVPMPVLPKP